MFPRGMKTLTFAVDITSYESSNGEKSRIQAAKMLKFCLKRKKKV